MNKISTLKRQLKQCAVDSSEFLTDTADILAHRNTSHIVMYTGLQAADVGYLKSPRGVKNSSAPTKSWQLFIVDDFGNAVYLNEQSFKMINAAIFADAT